MEGAIIAWSIFRFIDIILCRQKTSSYMSKKPDKPNPQREQRDPVPSIDPESPPSNNPSVPDDFSAKVAERKTPLFDSIHIVRGESIGQPTIHSRKPACIPERFVQRDASRSPSGPSHKPQSEGLRTAEPRRYACTSRRGFACEDYSARAPFSVIVRLQWKPA
jgi:hypothetical protein